MKQIDKNVGIIITTVIYVGIAAMFIYLLINH